MLLIIAIPATIFLSLVAVACGLWVGDKINS